MQKLPSLVLVSQSPRRKQILESLDIPFKSLNPKDTEEIHPTSHTVNEITRVNATKKAKSLLSDFSKDTVLIGCDTLVVLAESVLGKPKDKDEVFSTLKLLSGKTHTVVSGLSLVSEKYGTQEWNATTQVIFRKISDEEIKRYAETKEPYDKAGAYAVQGMGTVFIEKIIGSYTNVMGFPLELFLQELPGYTKIPLYQWFLP